MKNFKSIKMVIGFVLGAIFFYLCVAFVRESFNVLQGFGDMDRVMYLLGSFLFSALGVLLSNAD